MSLVFMGSMTPLAVFIVVAFIIGDPDMALFMMWIILFVVVPVLALFGALSALVMWSCKRRLELGLPVPGLYEGGLELPPWIPGRSRFVPYGEISRVEEDSTARWYRVRIYDANSMLIADFQPDFLGKDGLAVLYINIHEQENESKPSPKLIVWGPRKAWMEREKDVGHPPDGKRSA
jgi:hypothetical protein